jgi:hypothetical protein
MGLFQALKDLIGGVAENSPIGDVLQGVTDNEIVQGVQDQVTNLSESAGGVVDGVAEKGTTAVDEIKQNIGL